MVLCCYMFLLKKRKRLVLAIYCLPEGDFQNYLIKYTLYGIFPYEKPKDN